MRNKGEILRNKIAIYTAIFGEYDNLNEPPEVINNVDFYCFTDSSIIKSKKFKIVKEKRNFKDPTREARMRKILSHKYLSSYDYTIWIDGNVEIQKGFNPEKFINELGDFDIAMFEHALRKCVYEEAKACIKLKKDNPEKINKQINRYKKEGYPKNNGLGETPVVIRNHKSEVVNKINEMWWDELNNNSRRDQLSFNYVIWKNNANYKKLSGSIDDNKYFKKNLHILKMSEVKQIIEEKNKLINELRSTNSKITGSIIWRVRNKIAPLFGKEKIF